MKKTRIITWSDVLSQAGSWQEQYSQSDLIGEHLIQFECEFLFAVASRISWRAWRCEKLAATYFSQQSWRTPSMSYINSRHGAVCLQSDIHLRLSDKAEIRAINAGAGLAWPRGNTAAECSDISAFRQATQFPFAGMLTNYKDLDLRQESSLSGTRSMIVSLSMSCRCTVPSMTAHWPFTEQYSSLFRRMWGSNLQSCTWKQPM